MVLSIQSNFLSERFGDQQAIRLLAQAGFDAVDYSMFSSYVIPLVFENDDYLAYADMLRKTAEECGVFFNQAHAPFPSYRVGDDEYNRVIEPRLHRAIEFAGRLGVSSIVIHPVDFKLDNKKKNLAMYNALLPTAKKSGVRIALENMWGRDPRRGYIVPNVCSVPCEFFEYLEALDRDCFTACLDLGHIGLVGENEGDFIRTLGHEKLTCLHVHDTVFTQDSHTIPYVGKMDWEEIIRAFRDIDYSGDFTFESERFYEHIPADFLPVALKYVHDLGRYLISRIEE